MPSRSEYNDLYGHCFLVAEMYWAASAAFEVTSLPVSNQLRKEANSASNLLRLVKMEDLEEI